MMINDIKIHQTSHLTDESFLQAERTTSTLVKL